MSHTDQAVVPSSVGVPTSPTTSLVGAQARPGPLLTALVSAAQLVSTPGGSVKAYEALRCAAPDELEVAQRIIARLSSQDIREAALSEPPRPKPLKKQRARRASPAELKAELLQRLEAQAATVSEAQLTSCELNPAALFRDVAQAHTQEAVLQLLRELEVLIQSAALVQRLGHLRYGLAAMRGLQINKGFVEFAKASGLSRSTIYERIAYANTILRFPVLLHCSEATFTKVVLNRKDIEKYAECRPGSALHKTTPRLELQLGAGERHELAAVEPAADLAPLPKKLAFDATRLAYGGAIVDAVSTPLDDMEDDEMQAVVVDMDSTLLGTYGGMNFTAPSPWVPPSPQLSPFLVGAHEQPQLPTSPLAQLPSPCGSGTSSLAGGLGNFAFSPSLEVDEDQMRNLLDSSPPYNSMATD